MDYDTFLNLLAAIEPFISPQESYHGVPTIKANERLTLTLRFLATGETFRSLGFQFRISRSAISYIVISVCEALINHLGNLYLKTPSTNEEWMSVAREFQEKWQFPNAVGAIDGKHIVIIPPPPTVAPIITTINILTRLCCQPLLVPIRNAFLSMLGLIGE